MLSFRLAACLALLLTVLSSTATAARPAKLRIEVVDDKTGEPIAVRMHLKDARGRAKKVPRVPNWKGHFVFDGAIDLKLPPGRYTFEMERGPEYRLLTGHFTLAKGDEDVKTLKMRRFVDMKKEGWWSGELHIHRPVDQIELHCKAEDLHVAPVITWWNDRNLWKDTPIPNRSLVKFDTDRYYHLMAGEDEREGGALMYYNLTEPLPLVGSEREHPSPMKFLQQAKSHRNVHVDVEKPFWWDVPVWVASGMVDSIGLANNHMHRNGVYPGEAWGRPRDTDFYPGTHGNGRWTQDIYYHLLNCGLRIPPSAGSASGVLPNPVGYNRVYVYCGDDFTYERWWQGLRAGKVVVTNGPLLRPQVEGKPPGHVFTATAGDTVRLTPALNLSTRDKLDYLEVVKNGEVEHSVRLDKWAAAGGRLPELEFAESGWFLIRAVAANSKTYRFASTGPYYIQIGDKSRVSRESAQFFLDWVNQRARRIKIDEPDKKAEVVKYHDQAREFWSDLVSQANAE